MRHSRPTKRNEAGFALISVLWGLVILSLIAASLLASGTTSYRIERNVTERVKAGAANEAGIARAILALIDKRPAMQWRTDGHPYKFDYADYHITIRIQDEMGKIDLNAADRSVLQALFVAVGETPIQADTFADRILDWREPGDAKRLNGAKAKDYRDAGLSYVPRYGPFQSVDEVRLILDMTPELFARIEPALTIFSHNQFVRPETAPREVLLALPGMDEFKVKAILDAREGTVAASGSSGGNVGGAFAITAATTVSNAPVSRRIVVRITDDPARPYWVLASTTR